tara:strand:- start:178 stop:489 length:312 start_codon:yes stop_codon:yes gene_type:complete
MSSKELDKVENVFEEFIFESDTMKILKKSNYWVHDVQMSDFVFPLSMDEEELRYLLSALYRLELLVQQRAFIDVMHVHCDQLTIAKFLNMMADKTKKVIMFQC